jgi:O-antigen ligase
VLEVPIALPLSIDLNAGAWAGLVAFCAVAAFLGARYIFERGGVRHMIRRVATMGFVVSCIAMAQEATAHGAMYWRWPPLGVGAPPFGPFVNRNHFGTWVILAVPLVLGYLAAHATAHPHRPARTASWQARLRLAADGRTLWLTGAAVTMIVALVVSLSRSAMFGLAVALAGGTWVARRQVASRFGPMRLLAAVMVLAGLALSFRVDPSTVAARMSAAPVGLSGRVMIWRDTLPVVRDFWLTGTGAGTYDTVMLVYQRARPGVRFNQAHNHYLQLAAEGGLLLCLPLLLGLIAFGRAAALVITDDESGMYYVRGGALCGLAGVAAQSLFETGLTTPANVILAAIAAAIAIHVPIRAGCPSDS